MSRKKEKLARSAQGLQDQSFQHLVARMESVIGRLDSLLARVTEKTELALFLTNITDDFKFDLNFNAADLNRVTTLDLLGALEESERGQLCSESYRRMAREGINMDLTVIMVHRTSLHRMLRALLLRECLGTGNSSET